MNNSLSYERRSAEELIEWLKLKASELSEGRWTDFTSGDIGSVMLGLIAYLSDMNNFQMDKTASELFLDTAVERSSIMSILKLIGYQPRHYESAHAKITFKTSEDINNSIIPKYSTFTNPQGTITYTLMENTFIYKGLGSGTAYEGKRVVTNYNYSQITEDGKIYLADYKLGMNTIELFISGISFNDSGIPRVEDVRYAEGEFSFSPHVNEQGQVYIQLPTYWTDLVTRQSLIAVSYLLTSGEAGRVGANILTKPSSQVSLSNTYLITNEEASKGGYFPETADELKITAPRNARTMYTIVTKKDAQDLVLNLPIIADIKAGDYNDAWTGYIQPTPETGGRINDAYKCKILATPANINETSLYEDVYDWVLKESITSSDIYTGPDSTQITYTTNPDDLPEIYKIDDSKKESEGIRDIYVWEVVLEHQLTSTAKQMVELIDSKRVASLSMVYEDPKRLVPDLTINIFLDSNDLRRETIAGSVAEFIKQYYDREYCKIGKSIHYSILGRDIHLAFPQIDYVTLDYSTQAIGVDPDEYIDMYYARFRIYVNDELIIEEF